MIRYPEALPALIERLVDDISPKWRAAAALRTTAMTAAGRFSKGKPSWGDIKAVYMRLQYNKCIFCERPLGGEFAGKVEQDVEHFRPKNAVKSWPKKVPKAADPGYAFTTGGTGDGYHWLAYALENYAAACKACNSTRKGSFFPIAGPARGTTGDDVHALNAVEKPFLIYPLGTSDHDPEDLIEFHGILARPKHTAGPARDRAQVTIDFFALNDREELWTDRFRVIESLWLALSVINTSKDATQVATARRAVERATYASAPQASCARSFLRLFEADPRQAWEIYEICDKRLHSVRPSP